jgi:membrane fusion protein (multidrug efflux system)
VTLPATAIAYAPYGDSVFVVEQIQGPKGEKYKGARQQVVKLGGAVGDQVAVLSGSPGGRGGRQLRRLQAEERRRHPRG